MPPKNTSPTTHARWLSDFNSEENWPFKRSNDEEWYCSACEHKWVVRQKSHVEKHFFKGKHQENVRLKAERRFEEQDDSQDTEMAQELVQAFLAVNIPLSKLETPRFEGLLRETLHPQVSMHEDPGDNLR